MRDKGDIRIINGKTYIRIIAAKDAFLVDFEIG